MSGVQAAERAHGAKRKVRTAGMTRYIAAVPALGLFVASLALSIGTFISIGVSVAEFVTRDIPLAGLAADCLKYADLFLLSVALYILALGLVQLFITDSIVLPTWLTFHDFDDLKERLVGVISIMLAVTFLSVVMENEPTIDMLWLGLGCAAIILALGYFTRKVFKD